eukprot:2072130-Prymnesium_polylepis.1
MEHITASKAGGPSVNATISAPLFLALAVWQRALEPKFFVACPTFRGRLKRGRARAPTDTSREQASLHAAR